MSKPRLLDLFSGAGGAARGYQLAGFHVTGVDIALQPRYAGDAFVRGDALDPPVRLESFDAIHASPPCQHYSQATAWRGSRDDHPDLIDATRAMLEASGVPYIIENVEGARFHLRHPVMLCGSMFGLPVRRHRFFEAPTIPLALLPPCAHHPDDFSFDHGGKQTEREYSDAMGCAWMTVHEAREAIPPAFTKWIGERLLDALRDGAHRPCGSSRTRTDGTSAFPDPDSHAPHTNGREGNASYGGLRPSGSEASGERSPQLRRRQDDLG